MILTKVKHLLWFFFLCFMMLICRPGPSTDLTNEREDQLRQQRIQKSNKIQPEQQGAFERLLLTVENRMGEKIFQGKLGQGSLFTPQFGSVATGSGLTGGIRFGKGFFDSSAAYSTRGYQGYELQFGRNIPKKGFMMKAYHPTYPFYLARMDGDESKMFLYADLRYYNFPQEDFYGIGSDTSEQNRTDYKFVESSYNAVFGYQFGRRIRFDLRGGVVQPDVGRGTDDAFLNTERVFDDRSAPGLVRQPDFIRFSSAVLFDYRDHPGNPRLGGVVGLMFLRMDDRGGDLYEFNRLTVDARHYLPLGSPARVFAVRFLTSFSTADENHLVPFYYLDSLGGSHTLRGFHDYRFRDKHLLHLSGEYRFEPAPWLELALFYDTGKVFDRSSEFNFKNLEKGYGGGVRFKTPAGVFFRVDAGKSNEGIGVYVNLGSSF